MPNLVGEFNWYGAVVGYSGVVVAYDEADILTGMGFASLTSVVPQFLAGPSSCSIRASCLGVFQSLSGDKVQEISIS